MSNVSGHLKQWLHSAVRICGSIDDVEELSVESSCAIVGRHILHLADDASIEDVHSEISDIHDTETISQAISVLIEFLLVYAVSESCEQRGAFVEGIMTLETEAQMYLMQVIEHHTDENESNDADNMLEEDEDDCEEVEFAVEDVVVNAQQQMPVPTHAPIYMERTAHTDDHGTTVCSTCTDKDSFIKKMQQEMNQNIAKNGDEILRLKEENGVLNNKIVDMDVLMMEKDSTIFANCQALKDLEGHKEKFEQLVLKSSKLEEQVLVLQDELDVLKPQAAKLDFAEAQVDRLRSKLDELSDIKQQLKVESANHSETYDKLVALEQEVEGLRKLKVQVDDYRTQFAETSIAMQELQMRLEDSEAETVHLRAEVAALRGDQSEHRHQAQHLAEELRTTAEQLREKERMNGIGEGMSELNPALMQELNRLKNENLDLSTKLDHSAVEKLEALRKESDEVKCVNSSLQKKWMQAKDALAKTESEILSLTFRLHDKETECLALRFQIAETATMNTEDTSARKLQHARELAFVRKTHGDLLALTHQGHNTVLGIYGESLAQAHCSLEQTQQQVRDLTELQASTSNTLTDTQNELIEAGRKRKCLEIEHVEAIFGLNEEFAMSLESKAKKHKAELDSLQEQTQQAMATERQQMEQRIEATRLEMEKTVAAEQLKAADLSAELETEARRRRTTERAKKAAELDAQRLKLQLNAAMGADAGGDGVKSALQAITDMQQELSEAHAEIAALRARPHIAAEETTEDTAKNSTGSTSSLRTRPLRSTHSASSGAGVTKAGFDSLVSKGMIEQSDLAERKIDQLNREKREQISKNLEEQRERHEVAQRLLVVEKENSTLKAELRKITLDKERNERKLNKQLEVLSAQTAANKENVRN